MDTSLLERLLVKPIPKKFKTVDIILQRIQEDMPPVDIEAMGDEGAAALRQRLAQYEPVQKPPATPESTSEEPTPTPQPKAPKTKGPSKPTKSKPSKAISAMLTIEEEGASPPDLSLVVDKRGKTIEQRLPEIEDKVLIKASSYFMNNRKKFIQFITTLFLPYRQQLLAEESDISCDRRGGTAFSLLTHQKIVRDYINIFTPYRGLLLYHGLGTGKTCSSIAIAEGLKSPRPIIIMTPASLRMNYVQELKKCGDLLYKINQYWEFIPTSDNEPLRIALSKVLSLPQDFIQTQGGAWFINIKRKPNYNRLNTPQRSSIDAQVDKMISAKYFFINYNGLRQSHLAQLRAKLKQPHLFDNAVVIIDEVHNFVSRIVNKIGHKKALSLQLYEYLKRAKNCRIICLTGTPIINYPNEIAILFNILRGYIVSWTMPISINTQKKINELTMKKILSELGTVDYIRYHPAQKQLLVTRNPFGFVNAPEGGTKMLDERGRIDDKDFIQTIVDQLEKHNISVHIKQIKVQFDTALPDTLTNFNKWFIDERTGALKNQNIFKKRILGLTSHFRSPQEQLMAAFNKSTDLHVEKIPMSNYQLKIYEEAREGERKLEKRQAMKKRKHQGAENTEMYTDSTSTYRIFSRAFCNFVFPGEIKRPMPHEGADIKQAAAKNIDEDILDNATAEDRIENIDGRYLPDDAKALEAKQKEHTDTNYDTRIKAALKNLNDHKEEFLSKEALVETSPKFLAILNNIQTKEGLQLVYSQFRTLEGIGIFKLVLEANGFAQFKIIKNKRGSWSIALREEDKEKPKFILYTGTETAEEKEIMRNIFNSTWANTPRSIQKQLSEMATTNNHGEIAKVFMITAAGAEGISLHNVRYVHIMEPYWHPVRIEQVIGRARRICSHHNLPEAERKIEVFIYLMTFTAHQISELISGELRIKDVSKRDRTTPFTSDETIFEIAQIKETINIQLLKSVKEASIDCAVQMREGEDLVCFAMAGAKPSEFINPFPELTGGDDDDVGAANKKERKIKIRRITIGGKRFAYNPTTKEVYDWESYQNAKKNKAAEPIVVGKLIKNPTTGKPQFVPI